MKLTKSDIDRASYEGTQHPGKDGKTKWSRCVLWDDAVRGLGLRITQGGKKTFVLSYRAGSRKRLMTLGAYGVLTIQQARDKARKELASVIEGQDPLGVRQTAADAETVNDLAKRYLSEHAEVKKKPASARTDWQMLRDYVLPKLGRLRVDEVTRRDISTLHHSLREKPYVANRVLALVSKMLNLAEKSGLRPERSNPCRLVDKFKEHKRERYLSPGELGNLAEAIAEAEESETEGTHALAAIRLLILTGCRLREILHLRSRYREL